MNRVPVLPESDHRPPEVDELIQQATTLAARLRTAERHQQATEAALQRGPEVDAEALMEALTADKPAPPSVLPGLEAEHQAATNGVNALTRLLADTKTKLNETINAAARAGWYAAELADAEKAEDLALAAMAKAAALVDAARLTRSRADWLARSAAGQVRDFTGPEGIGPAHDLTEKARNLLGVPQRERAEQARQARRDALAREAAERAEAEAVREAREARRAAQAAGELRGRERYLDALGRLGGADNAA